MNKSVFIVPSLLICGATIFFNSSVAKYTAVTSAAVSGKTPAENYQNYCSSCHGEKMDAFVDRDWKHGNKLSDLVRGISKGYADDGMPAFEKTFTAKEIEELSSYIIEGINNRAAYDFDDQPKSNIFKSDKLTVKLDTIATGLDVPWGMAFLKDGSLLVTERGGKLYKVANKKNTEIKGIPEVLAQGQGGLMDIVLHPDFEKNQILYLSYSKPKGKLATTAVVHAKLEGNTLVNQKMVFEALPYASTRHHYGSRMAFDKNNYLFISVGERGNERENPQSLDNSLGKIHRINADGSIPADNPFKDKEGKPTSLYTCGNRNPQGIAFHPVTGELWETEHGPRGGDEINIIAPGKNYGWPLTSYGINYNGTTITDKTTAPGIEEPLLYWLPSIAPSGTAFVTGDNYKPWKGALLVGSLRFKYLNLCYLDGHKITGQEKLLKNIGRVRDVRMAPDGYIYVAVEDNKGSVYRLVPVN
ncbi:PQQ-dependent sugar dehydrogenase [Flavobacterium sp. DG1-102-2]|uniref:PQQ-dependent sugar dehydrogenase n=1 Tax=Flavobacterium sp. DG1-102-2 TaxID=3081663 RepID=UPI00294A62A8|nr:PQQ-dependent sugar dehydrogenase [Flavobacterium sp. DG1-102-2]MDV6166808.1 PQQ-dependent sugar dehydrogenase [Flavobacterium sp. DG1-102-2]